ncbi:Calx-beta domain-containing protein [Fodinicola feengrottensis]|uniref:Calx-beta domain-containing protein n=1 Tax=Fodinicola feengrottensis TaxID=435914 RepID=UPI0031E16CB9
MVATLAATALIGALGIQSAAAAGGVDPANVDLTLGPGQSAVVNKTVHTAPVPPKPDIVFLADTTGSMGPAIANVRSNATMVMQTVAGQSNLDAEFGAAQYQDFDSDPSDVPFQVDQDITSDQTAVQTGIGHWNVGDGVDTPEAWVNALYQLATGAVHYRDGGTRIIALFGDSSSHDPSGGHTLDEAIAVLKANPGIRVVLVGVHTDSGDGLDSAGQASRVANETGGVFLDNVGSDQVAQKILEGIQKIKVTVAPKVAPCDANLALSFDHPNQVVESGGDATFAETVKVAANAPAGTYHCTVDWQVNGMSQGFLEQITVHVPGLSINDVTVTEGNSGTTPANFTVSLAPASDKPVTVHYATSDGTATAGSDYQATNGDLTFTPGQTTKTVTVPVIGDLVDEPNETFNVDLSAASGSAIVDGHGVGTIIDDDRNGTFSCRSSVIRIASTEPVVANGPDAPCRDDHQTVARVNVSAGLISVQANGLDALTDQQPNDLTGAGPAAGDNGSAKATLASVTIVAAAQTVKLTVVQSQAQVECVAGPSGLAPKLTSSSKVTGVSIDGVPVTVGSGPVDIPLVIGTLHINNTVTTGTSVTQRAVYLHTLLTDVVVAESKADFHGTSAHPAGNPCQS